jgi:hypothetical protein
VDGDIEPGDVWQAWRRQAALQRARQLLGTALMSQRLVSQVTLALQFGDEHLAIDERAPPLAGCLLAVAFGHQAVLGCPHALLGGVGALSRGAAALLAGTQDDVGARQGALTVGALVGSSGLRDRDIARGRCLVSRKRCHIAGVGDRVTLLGGLHSRLGAVIAFAGSALTRGRGALADALADVVHGGITAGHQVLVAGGLIAIGGDLVAVSARLVAVSARLIDIRQRLIAVGRRLVGVREALIATSMSDVVLERFGDRGAAVAQSPIHAARGTI